MTMWQVIYVIWVAGMLSTFGHSLLGLRRCRTSFSDTPYPEKVFLLVSMLQASLTWFIGWPLHLWLSRVMRGEPINIRLRNDEDDEDAGV